MAGTTSLSGAREGTFRLSCVVAPARPVTWRLSPQAEAVLESEPEPIELDIRFEDEHCLVINKPAGLVVHPGAGNPRGTLMNGLLHYIDALDQLPRAGIIHRLDKDTSGLLLVAKSLEAHNALTLALSERRVSRHYLAVCNGVLTGGGTIDAANREFGGARFIVRLPAASAGEEPDSASSSADA